MIKTLKSLGTKGNVQWLEKKKKKYIENSDDNSKDCKYMAQRNLDSKDIGYIDNNNDHSKELTYIAKMIKTVKSLGTYKTVKKT